MNEFPTKQKNDTYRLNFLYLHIVDMDNKRVRKPTAKFQEYQTEQQSKKQKQPAEPKPVPEKPQPKPVEKIAEKPVEKPVKKAKPAKEPQPAKEPEPPKIPKKSQPKTSYDVQILDDTARYEGLKYIDDDIAKQTRAIIEKYKKGFLSQLFQGQIPLYQEINVVPVKQPISLSQLKGGAYHTASSNSDKCVASTMKTSINQTFPSFSKI